MQDLNKFNIFTPLPIPFQLNLNTNTECMNSLNVIENYFKYWHNWVSSTCDVYSMLMDWLCASECLKTTNYCESMSTLIVFWELLTNIKCWVWGHHMFQDEGYDDTYDDVINIHLHIWDDVRHIDTYLPVVVRQTIAEDMHSMEASTAAMAVQRVTSTGRGVNIRSSSNSWRW